MRTKQMFAALCVALLITASAAAAPEPAAPLLSFERFTLPNGMRVVLHVDRKLPLVHVNLWYHVGSKNEPPGRTGFAHLFEHLMLQGSKNAPEDYFTLMARIGARGGRDSNGTTSTDRTNYFATAPSGSLDYLLWVHADLLATFPEALTQQKLDNQREVVRNERRQGIDNAPYGRWHKLLLEQLFPARHPYSWPIIGSHEDLQAARLDDVRAFFATYYTPNNLSLVVSGDFDPEEARRLVEKHFAAIAPGPALDRPRFDLPRLDREKVIEVRDRVALERVFIAFPTPQIGGEGERELELTAGILTDGLSSRLTKTLVHERKLCTSVQAFTEPMELASMFVIDATLQSGASMQEVERVVAETLSALAARGPSARELTRARALAVTRLTSSLQNVGAFGGVADTLNHYNVFYDDPGKLGWDVARLAAVTPASLQRAVRTWLDTPNRLVLRFRPEASARPTTPAPDRTKPPALGADQLFRPPAVQSARLDNGLEVFVVERHELPLVTAGIVSRAGSVVDPPGKEGLAGWVTSSMGRGTRRLGALALDDAFGALGTALHARTMLEYATQAVEVQRAQLGAALALVAEVTRQPRFAEDELARARRLQREAVEQAVSDPSELRRRLRARFAFGAAHPYGRPTFGFPRTIDGFTRDDAVRLHAAQWTPGGAALIFVGDVTLADARRLAEQTFGSWRGAGPAPIEIPPAAPIARGKVVLVDKPGAAQTVIAHLYDAPRQKAADFYPLLLVSDVLGGNASGRLYANLRQDKGYTYGVGCGLVPAAGPMTWFAQLAVQTDKTAPAVTELRAELSNIAGARPIGANELEAARLGRIRNYAAGFGTHTDVAMQVADLWARRWPMDELVRAPEALMRASLSEVNAAAARYAAPADAALLLIGDRGKIEAPLRALKKVEIVVVDVEGNPVK